VRVLSPRGKRSGQVISRWVDAPNAPAVRCDLAAVVALDRKCEHQRGEAECRRKVEEWAKRYERGESLADKESAIIRPDLVRLSTVEARDVELVVESVFALGNAVDD